MINQPLGCKKSIILIAIVLTVESLKSILIWLTRCSRKEVLFSKVFSITSPAEVVLEDFIISLSDKFLFSRLKSDDRWVSNVFSKSTLLSFLRGSVELLRLLQISGVVFSAGSSFFSDNPVFSFKKGFSNWALSINSASSILDN